MKWSKDRFSIITTTTWSIPEVPGDGRDTAASACWESITDEPPESAKAPPAAAAVPRKCRRVIFTRSTVMTAVRGTKPGPAASRGVHREFADRPEGLHLDAEP